MKAIGIRKLQKKSVINNQMAWKQRIHIITKRNKPIGITISFDDKIITAGLTTLFLIDAYQNFLIELGELAKLLNMSKKEEIKFLSSIGVDVINYDFEYDLKTAGKFFKPLPLD